MITAKKDKAKINILLNIYNFYGKHTGGLDRILIFIVVAVAPFLFYTLLLAAIIPFKIFMIVFIPYCIKMALVVIGKESEKREAFIKQKNDQYASAKELIKVLDVHEDGLIEYTNGTVCYVIQCYGYSYFDDNSFSKDIELFISKILSSYEVDVYGHLVTEELETSIEDLEKLSVYEDKEFLRERLEYYKYQDRYTNTQTKLYSVNFVIRCYKSGWFKLKEFITTLLKSEFTECFNVCRVCNRGQAVGIMSRDLSLFIDIGEMLHSKYSSENYYGSKVMYFGDNVPDSMVIKDVTFEDEVDRRVIDDK